MIERAKLALLSRELTKLKDSQIDWLISSASRERGHLARHSLVR